MNIHILNNYYKEVETLFEGHFDILPIKLYLEEEILEYSHDSEIDDDVIEEEILSFLKDEDCEIEPFNEVDMVSSFSKENKEGLEVINLKELVKYFSYLKRLPIKNDCCDNQTGNYCSICGTKLKNN